MNSISPNLSDTIKDEVQKIKAQWGAAFADGSISVAEAYSLVANGVASFVNIIDTLDGLTTEERKAAVLELVDETYTEVIAPLDIPGLPNGMEKLVIDPLIGQGLQVLVSALLETYVQIIGLSKWVGD